jgi:serine protease
MKTSRLLLPLTLILLLAGCQLFSKPELTVTSGPWLAGSDQSASISISNTGERYSRLQWQASTPDPGLSVEPDAGSLAAGETVEVRITAPAGSRLPLDASVTVSSRAGTQTVTLGGPDAYYCVRDGSPAVLTAADGPRFVPGQLLIRYAPPPGLLPASLAASFQDLQSLSLRADHQLTLLERGSGFQPELVAVSGDPLAAARQLERDPRVLSAEPNHYLYLLASADCREEQWHLTRFGIPAAWRQREGSSEVVVAVIDSGVDTDHPDLAGNLLPGYRFTGSVRSPDPRPGPVLRNETAHGTHVSGIIGALGRNDHDIIGAAPFPAVRILPIRIFDDEGTYATTSDLIAAVSWAIGLPVRGVPDNPHPARIINLSLGGPGASSSTMNTLMSNARQQGALVIAAAGNIANSGSAQGVFTPANSPHVIAVGSVNADSRRSIFSEYGGTNGVTLMAPGGSGPSSCGGVRSTMPDARYGCMQGTSMATPFVSAVAALVLTREPHLTVDELEARLIGASYFNPVFMNSTMYGSGALCAERAILNENPWPSTPCLTN